MIQSPIVNDTFFSKAIAILESNYGTAYSHEKIRNLFQLIQDDGWSEERFNRTFLWFRKNRPFPAWTEADWFSFIVKVYPYEWYLKQCREGMDVLKQMDVYQLPNGARVYKWKDGQDLPFPKNEEIPVKPFKTLEIVEDKKNAI